MTPTPSPNVGTADEKRGSDMLTPMARRVYAEHRRYGARVALRIARAATAPLRFDWSGWDEADAGTVDGFAIRVKVEPIYDEPTDISWLGEWTDDEGPDTVPNPQATHGSYSHFRCEYTFEDRFSDFRRTHTADEARRLAREAMEGDAQLAHDLTDYIVTVEACEGDRVVGSASFGSDWTDADDDRRMAEDVAIGNGMIEEAVSDAWQSRARRLGNLGPQLLATVGEVAR